MFIAGIILLIFLIILRSYTLLLFSIFLIVLSFNNSLASKLRKIKLSPRLKFIILGLITGILTEILAIIDNLQVSPDKKALFSPDPFLNIFIGLGYYFIFFLIWSFLLNRYKYSLLEAFVIAGIFGLIVEQNASILLSFNFLAWIYVFLVHASILSIPLSILIKEQKGNKKSYFLKYILAIVLPLLSLLGAILLQLLISHI